MKRILTCGFVLCALLTACGGGGGGGGTPATSTPLQTPTTGPLTTNATGKVVDDTTGSALAGISVAIAPWTAGATPLPAPVATTDANGNFTLSTVPNGHYLLIIGSNLATDTTYTTVHDNVTLSGGNQILVAPTLPAIHGYTPAAWETNGTYRISHIDATKELPCFQRFNTDRTNAAQPTVPLDEWVTENVRAINADRLSASPTIGTPISSQNGSVSSGLSTCNTMIDGAFPPNAGAFGNDARVAWVGAQITGTTSYVGYMESPFDPRGYTDPLGNWP